MSVLTLTNPNPDLNSNPILSTVLLYTLSFVFLFSPSVFVARRSPLEAMCKGEWNTESSAVWPLTGVCRSHVLGVVLVVAVQGVAIAFPAYLRYLYTLLLLPVLLSPCAIPIHIFLLRAHD